MAEIPSLAATNTPDADGKVRAPVRVGATRSFIAWMTQTRCALAFTSYRRGLLLLLGIKPDGQLYCHTEVFRRATGLWLDGPDLWMGTMRQLWRLTDVIGPGETGPGGADRLYAPRQAWSIGEVDVHELGLDGAGRPVFCNTQYSCLATPHATHAFQPLWTPPFVSELAAGDRCHLNGVAFEDGRPAYVSCLGASDAPEGWRAAKADGGVVVETAGGRITASGLSMPHSPRVRDGQIWVAKSGRGSVVRIDPTTGAKADVVFLPGFLRGLAFHAGAALTTLSMARGDQTFAGLPLQDELERRGVEAYCGIGLFDADTGQVIGGVKIDGVEELFDLTVLPGAVYPLALPAEPAEGQAAVTFTSEFGAL